MRCVHLQHEFPNVNPIIPSHYFYLAKRCFKALQENNGKVRKQLPLEGLLNTCAICLAIALRDMPLHCTVRLVFRR